MTLTSPTRPGREDAALAETAVTLQSDALRLLLAEMQALAHVLGGPPVHPRSDAEVEAEFDNMPV